MLLLSNDKVASVGQGVILLISCLASINDTKVLADPLRKDTILNWFGQRTALACKVRTLVDSRVALLGIVASILSKGSLNFTDVAILKPGTSHVYLY